MVTDVWEKLPGLPELTAYDIWRFRREFLERLWPTVAGMSVLEVGSGPAHDSLTFSERGAKVTAVDISHPGLIGAKMIFRECGLSLDPVQADAARLPFQDECFDLVFNAGVLEHFPDDQREKVIEEMIRVVRRGGWVLAFCPNRYNVFYQFHLRRVRHHRYDYERAFTGREIKSWFTKGGLKDVQVSGVHVHPAINYLMPEWLPKHHRIEPLCRWSFAWFEQSDRWHGLKAMVGQDVVVWGKK